MPACKKCGKVGATANYRRSPKGGYLCLEKTRCISRPKPREAIDVSVSGRVYEDFLSPSISGMEAELELGTPERRKVGKGERFTYRAVPLARARELAEYLYDRGDTLLGQGIVDPYDPFEKAERATLRAAIAQAEKIREELEREEIARISSTIGRLFL